MRKEKREIKNRWTGAVIHSGEVDSFSDLVVANKADLRGADLCGANLRVANLGDADLRGADLRGADLRDADLRGANLCDANLGGADLGGANLRGAYLRGVPFIPNIHSAVYAAASATDEALNMSTWHTCETTHCRAGWVIKLAGRAGAAMEWFFGTPAAAALIYMRSDPKLERVPDFYTTKKDALENMKFLAEAEMQANAPA